jgi:hypothetical protein
MSQAQAENRPVYVRFEFRAVEDRAESIKEGHFVARDVAYVIVTPPGGNLEIEAQAEEWLRRKAADPFIEHYRKAYEAWRAGQEEPEYGTPVRSWPAVSPAQIAACVAAKIRTVEDLATAPEEALARIGNGARALQNKAQKWLESAATTGVSAEKIATLERDKAALESRVDELTQEVERLTSAYEARPRRGRPPKEAE